MSSFALHDPQSAPEAARPLLEQAARSTGFVPNLYRGLAESPPALQAYFDLGAAFAKTGLTPTEQQVVLLVTSAQNGCAYCMAAHSSIARRLVKVDPAVIEALRAGRPVPEPRLEALAQFTRHVVRQRGWVPEADLQAFLDAGFTHARVLDVVLGVTMKTLSNYTNHLLHPPLDDAFAAERWQAPDAAHDG